MQCKKNWKQHHIQKKSKFLPCYLIIGRKCTFQNILMSLNTLFKLHMKLKNQVEYQQNLVLKKGKTITSEIRHLVTNSYGDDNFSRQVPEKKDYVSKSKGVHKQKLCKLQKSFSLQELYTTFKQKHPNVNIGFAKICALKPKWYGRADLKMTHSVCVCSAHQNVALLVDAVDWDLTYKDLLKLTLPCLKYFH